jgi:hypothetical protein
VGQYALIMLQNFEFHEFNGRETAKMLFLLDGQQIQVRHLTKDGNNYYFKPSHLMRKAGYTVLALGSDLRDAIARAAEVNSAWDADPARRRRHKAAYYETSRGFIYFVAAGPAIKVGFSRQPQEKMAALRTTSAFPLDLIGIIVATQQLEKQIHSRLAAHKCESGGEDWFYDIPEVREVIASYLAAQYDRSAYQMMPQTAP